MASDAQKIIADALLAFVEEWNGEPDPEQGAAQAVHSALADAGLLDEPGGETRPIWRCYDLESGGAYVAHSLEGLEQHCRDARTHEPDPLSPAPHPSEHQVAQHTVWPDGSEHTSAWRRIEEQP